MAGHETQQWPLKKLKDHPRQADHLVWHLTGEQRAMDVERVLHAVAFPEKLWREG